MMREISPNGRRSVPRRITQDLLASAGLMALAAVALVGATPAQAQASPKPSAQTGGVEEIVVTAQRREENLQDVPIAVTPITQDVLVGNRVQNLVDLNSLAPGLLIRRSPGGLGSPTVAMRGVSASPSAGAQDRQIALYIDGVSVGTNRGVLVDLPDLARVEVLRGPQGTLFGRNSTAGAVSIITREPTGDFSALQEITLGNYGQFRSRTTIDSPEFGPFSAYVTYMHDQRRGDVSNLGAGATFDRTNPFFDYGVTSSSRTLGARNSENVFAAIRFQPASNFRSVYRFNYASSIVSSEARAAVAVNPRSLTGALINSILLAQPAGGGRYGSAQIYINNERPDAVANPFSQPIPMTAQSHNLTTTWDIGDGWSVRNITGYRRSRVEAVADVAGPDGLELTAAALPAYATFVARASVPGFNALTPAQQAPILANLVNNLTPQVGRLFVVLGGQSLGTGRQFSTEFTLNYQSDFLTLTAGLLYYRAQQRDGGLPGFRNTISFSPLDPLVPLGSVSATLSRVRSFAAYAQAEFHLSPQLDVVFGGRLTRDEKDGELVSGGTFTGTRTDGTLINTRIDPYVFNDTRPNYAVAINYHPNNDLLFYTRYATGFISGGATGPFPFLPETVRSFELGTKLDLLDRRLRINVAAYAANYQNLQASAPGSNFFVNGVAQPQLGAVVVNNGQLRSRGVEAEVTAVPIDGLTLNASLGYNSARLRNPSPLIALGRPYQQANVAPWIGSASLQYERPIAGDTSLLFRLDSNYQGRYRAIAFTDIATVIPEFAQYEFVRSQWLLNGRLALRRIQIGRMEGEIAVWARNLTNSREGNFVFQLSDAVVVNSFQNARTVGVDFIARFR